MAKQSSYPCRSRIPTVSNVEQLPWHCGQTPRSCPVSAPGPPAPHSAGCRPGPARQSPAGQPNPRHGRAGPAPGPGPGSGRAAAPRPPAPGPPAHLVPPTLSWMISPLPAPAKPPPFPAIFPAACSSRRPPPPPAGTWRWREAAAEAGEGGGEGGGGDSPGGGRGRVGGRAGRAQALPALRPGRGRKAPWRHRRG